MDATGAGYALLGEVLSLAGLSFAWLRSRSGRSAYAADLYRMTARSHRRFALLSAAFAAAFALALRWPVLDVPLLALYGLALTLYLSSFARGFSGDDE